MIYNSVLELIGNTKLVKLNRISDICENEIYAKIESTNPFGSVKDRIAYNMIKTAFEEKLINEKTVIIEPTSGNTGIAIAAIALYYKLKCIIVMPENMSKERVDMMRAYKAEVILTPKSLGMNGSIEKVEELKKQHSNYYSPSQFQNIANPLIHYKTTGPEIYNEINLDYFFAGIGTGGTISGCGRYFKEQNKDIKLIGIEPLNSAVINNKEKGTHKIQGIGAGFIPKTLSVDIIDEVMMVSDDDAFKYMHYINDEEVLFVGISSGAALAGIIQYIEKYKIKNKKIVTVFPDSYIKYLSSESNLS